MSRPTSLGAGTQQHRGSVTFGADSGPAGPSSRGHDGHVYGAIKAPSHQLAGQAEPGQGLTGQEEAVTQDDYHAILSVHGFDTVADATVIDLHETGIRTVAPLAVFSNAQVRFNEAACAMPTAAVANMRDMPCADHVPTQQCHRVTGFDMALHEPGEAGGCSTLASGCVAQLTCLAGR